MGCLPFGYLCKTSFDIHRGVGEFDQTVSHNNLWKDILKNQYQLRNWGKLKKSKVPSAGAYIFVNFQGPFYAIQALRSKCL